MSKGLYAGMAPEAVLLVGKVLDREGNGNVENVMAGIRWILEQKDRYGVRIVNISVGTQPDLAVYQKYLFLDAVEELWDSGLVVVVSAGNYGPGTGTVAVPGTSRKVITVGVPDTELPPVQRRAKNINYSGRGPTGECVVKPDVFAPGTGIISCNGRYGRSGEHPYTMKTGTSMATPFVTGAMALWLQACPDLTPEKAKEIMRTTAINDNFTGDVRADGDYAWGYGKLDVLAGIKECIKSSGIDGGETLLDVPFVVRDEAGAVSVLFTRDLTDAALTVTSVDGKVVMADTGRNFAAGEEVRLMADGYAPGIYLVTILSPDGGRHTEKIIID